MSYVYRFILQMQYNICITYATCTVACLTSYVDHCTWCARKFALKLSEFEISSDNKSSIDRKCLYYFSTHGRSKTLCQVVILITLENKHKRNAFHYKLYSLFESV